MIKTILKAIVIAVIGIVNLTSCSDYLSVKPMNVLALASYDEVKALLGAHLKGFANPSSSDLKQPVIPYMGAKEFWLLFHIYSDDVDTDKYIKSSLGNNNKVLLSTAIAWNNPDIAPKLWETYYLNIGFYNTIIDELSKMKCSREQSDIVKYEATVLRAWHIFKLMQYFSPYKMDKYGIPLNLNAQKVGVYDSERKTQKQVYKVIIDDLTEALNCATPTRETYNVFYDKRIISAILAQVYLFKGESGAGESSDYTNAATHAKEAMTGRNLQGLSNYLPAPAVKRQGVDKTYEYSLYIDNRSDYAMQNITGGTYYAVYPTDELYNLYGDDDIRKTMFFDATKKIIKYKNLEYYSQYNFFSVAEMHLIVAESYSRAGNNGEAKKWLDDFKKCRIKNYTGYNGNNLLDEVLKERRKEFCYEYDMRWCDLIRTQKGWSRNSFPSDENPISKIEDNDYRFCFPIPITEELQYNDIEQNPGWKVK